MDNRGKFLIHRSKQVCVFRLFSTKLLVNRRTGCTNEGSVGNPDDQAWPPTTRDYLLPIFSCIGSHLGSPKTRYSLCVIVGM